MPAPLAARIKCTYVLTAAPTFQLCCLRSFAAVLLSACVTLLNSAIALFCEEVYAGGIFGQPCVETRWYSRWICDVRWKGRYARLRGGVESACAVPQKRQRENADANESISEG